VLEQQPQLDGIRPIYATFLSALGFNEEARAQLTDEVIKTANTDHDIAYWLEQRTDLKKMLASLRLAVAKTSAPEKTELLKKLQKFRD